MGEGLRHSVISALAEIMPERALRAHTRHRDGRSLDQYARGAKPDYAAMVARVSPEFFLAASARVLYVMANLQRLVAAPSKNVMRMAMPKGESKGTAESVPPHSPATH
jgi:hypothetical protein